MKLSLRLALKDIFSHRRFSSLFVLNLVFGLMGLALVENFRTAINYALLNRSKGVLAADLSVGARRPLTDLERSIMLEDLPEGSQTQKTFEAFTMLAGQQNSRLVELKAVEPGYPFYGEIELKNRGVLTGQSSDPLFAEPRIWVFPELLIQLGLESGDKVRIGQKEFTIDDTVLRDSSSVGAGFSFAPPVYMAYSELEQTGLMTTTSRGYSATLIRLPEGIDNKMIAESLHTKLSDPAVRVVTSQNASEQVGRALGYLTDYLGLAGLIAMFLTAIGQYFLFRNYIARRRTDIAILRSLGTSTSVIFSCYSLQVVILSLLSLAITLLLSAFIVPFFTPLITEYLKIELSYKLTARTLLIVAATAFWGSFLTSLPLLLQSLQVRAKELFGIESKYNQSTATQLFRLLPNLIFFTVLSVIVANSYKIGLLFVFVLFLASLLAFGASLILFQGLALVPQKNFIVKASIRQLLRERYASLTAFMVLTLAVTLTSLLPQIESGLKEELETPTGIETPSLFMFDIQDEQKNDLISLVNAAGVIPQLVAPMIRARLSKVNNQDFEKGEMRGEGLTREQENENRFRNRGFNLSYRQNLSPSERILKGKEFSEVENNKALISLERRFADRLGLKINDELVFDIQGIAVAGQVVNLRHVRWTSFQPNFFIQFNEGILEDAPKTFILTLPRLSDDKKMELQNQVVKSFPNVSIIDVSRLVDRMSNIIGQMSLALQAMSLFTVVVGLLVLYAIQVLQVYYRRKDINLYKVLGANFSILMKMAFLESGILALMSVVSGLIIARSLNFVLARELFEGLSKSNPQAELLVALSFFTIIFLVVWISTVQVLRKPPQSLFQEP